MQKDELKQFLISAILISIMLFLVLVMSFISCCLCYFSNFFESSDASKIIGFFIPTIVAIWTYMIYYSPEE